MTNALKEYSGGINLIMKQIAFTYLKITITIVTTVMLLGKTDLSRAPKNYPRNTYDYEQNKMSFFHEQIYDTFVLN